jgi:protein-tyrosine phosphatase
MLDLHCHILPGIDDGAASLDESLAMARFSAADGITHIVATPHCHRSWHYLRADIVPRVARLNEAIAKAGIGLMILPGSEIQAVDTALYRREYEAGLYCHLGDRPAFTLLEFSWKADEFPADAIELIRWLRDRGTTPIIAHPERHPYYADTPGRLESLVDAGAWLQVTVDSLLGNFGSAPRTESEAVLRKFADVVLATDSHNMRRCSGLSAGFKWVRERLGAERDDELRARADQVLAAIATS